MNEQYAKKCIMGLRSLSMETNRHNSLSGFVVFAFRDDGLMLDRPEMIGYTHRRMIAQ